MCDPIYFSFGGYTKSFFVSLNTYFSCFLSRFSLRITIKQVISWVYHYGLPGSIFKIFFINFRSNLFLYIYQYQLFFVSTHNLLTFNFTFRLLIFAAYATFTLFRIFFRSFPFQKILYIIFDL